MNEKSRHIAAIHKIDCYGVPLEQLLAGRESACPECETEISTLRCVQMNEPRQDFTVDSEIDRVLNWPMI